MRDKANSLPENVVNPKDKMLLISRNLYDTARKEEDENLREGEDKLMSNVHNHMPEITM